MINLQKIEKITDLYIEKLILPSDPLYPLWNRENFIFSKRGKWNYIDGCIIKAATMLYDLNSDERLLEFSLNFIDAYVDENGSIPTINPLDYNLDNVNGAKNLLYLFKKTGRKKYLYALEMIYHEQLENQPRLNCGNFYHKAVYPNQIWLDGAYMALPFLAEYAVFSNKYSILTDIENQVLNIIRIMRDSSTGLYKHAYDESHSMFWSNRQTGLSSEFWLRAMGWYCAALADICELVINASATLYGVCSSALSKLIDALSNYISNENMLHQLPAYPELGGNYPETSGTLLFSYAALKSYRLGICGEKAKTDGVRTLSAVTDYFIEIKDNELPVLKNICLVAGLGGASCRSGSAEYYLSEPVVENDAKGIAPFLMAYAELKRLSLNQRDRAAELSPKAFSDNEKKYYI